MAVPFSIARNRVEEHQVKHKELLVSRLPAGLCPLLCLAIITQSNIDMRKLRRTYFVATEQNVVETSKDIPMSRAKQQG
jgi:hypothetical protein